MLEVEALGLDVAKWSGTLCYFTYSHHILRCVIKPNELRHAWHIMGQIGMLSGGA